MPLNISNITGQLASNPAFDDHETIIWAENPDTGFKIVVSVHNTKRGIALGGCRFWHYENEDDAITDVLRLSRGMTYKNSLANLALGGGKTVILAPSANSTPTEQDMEQFGEVLNSDLLANRYVTAEDVGVSVENMRQLFRFSDKVAGIPIKEAGSIPPNYTDEQLPHADPSPYTAYGVYTGIKASAAYRMDSDLKGLTIAVKGFGHVAKYLCERLHNDGAGLIISEVNQARRDEIVEIYGPDALLPEGGEIMAQKADIYAPCALGADINDKTIRMLKDAGVKIVAGAANNQLTAPKHGKMLRDANILYAPDYVINAGGVISAGLQYLWTEKQRPVDFPSHERLQSRIDGIHTTLLKIYNRSDEESEDTATIADIIAREGFERRGNGSSSSSAYPVSMAAA